MKAEPWRLTPGEVTPPLTAAARELASTQQQNVTLADLCSGVLCGLVEVGRSDAVAVLEPIKPLGRRQVEHYRAAHQTVGQYLDAVAAGAGGGDVLG